LINLRITTYFDVVRSHKKSAHKRGTRKRVTSIRSAGSGPSSASDSDSDVEEDKIKSEDEDEDLPEVSFSRVFAMNKPELFYILCKWTALFVSAFAFFFLFFAFVKQKRHYFNSLI